MIKRSWFDLIYLSETNLYFIKKYNKKKNQLAEIKRAKLMLKCFYWEYENIVDMIMEERYNKKCLR